MKKKTLDQLKKMANAIWGSQGIEPLSQGIEKKNPNPNPNPLATANLYYSLDMNRNKPQMNRYLVWCLVNPRDVAFCPDFHSKYPVE